MARLKRRQPYDPNKPHDRRASDFVRGAQVAPMIVVDPLGLEPGDTIVVMRSTRNDPLANLHSRKSIDEAQYQAGRAFQSDFEAIQAGPQAIDASQPYVDRSFRHRSMSDAFSGALARLKRADRELGQLGASLARDVLIHGMTVQQVGAARGSADELALKYLGRRFRECLDTLAVVYDLAMEKRA